MSNPALTDDVYQKARADELGAGWASPTGAAPTSPGFISPPPPPPYVPSGADQVSAWPPAPSDYKAMRVNGVASATGVLLALLLAAAWFGYQSVDVVVVNDQVLSTKVPPYLIGSFFLGLGLAFLTIFRPKVARITGPLYAVAEGLLLGAISHLYEVEYKGIILQAVGLTVGIFAVMLFMFAFRIIRVTEKLRMAIIASTIAICLVYLADIVAGLFGSGVPMINEAGPVGIGFSLLVCGIASLRLLLNFDTVEKGVAAGAPRYMEWYSAFGLILTLVWLYLELLRLLSKLRQR